MAANDKSVTFNHDEKLALQQIVSDWLHEEFVAPPFEPATAAALQKLGLGEKESIATVVPAGYPKTQEVLSEVGKQEKRH